MGYSLKEKIAIRMKQLQVLASSSRCPRRKFGAMLLHPERNAIVADGYNGGPRGSTGDLCKGSWCERDGILKESCTTKEGSIWGARTGWQRIWNIEMGEAVLESFSDNLLPIYKDEGKICVANPEAYGAERIAALAEKYPPIPSGTRLERGCHHAEMNALMNAAAQGAKTAGLHLLVTGEPCLMCAKLIHHAGIVKVWYIRGGYLGGSDGIEYLNQHHVSIEALEGEADPRIAPKVKSGQ